MDDNVIQFPRRPGMEQLAPEQATLPPEFWDLVAQAQHSGDAKLETLVRGIFYLADTIDSVELLASQFLIDSEDRDDPFHPYNLIAEICRLVNR